MSPFQRFLCGLAAALPAACAGAPAKPSGDEAKVLVRLRNFRTGEHFELASESHTDRVAYYSDQRADAARKIQSDEIMAALVEELDRHGFDDHAQPGKAPSVASGDVIRWGIEVERGPRQSHWLVGTGSAPKDWQTFQECRDTFLQLYNITVSYQTVQNQSGRQFFQEPPRGAAAQKKP